MKGLLYKDWLMLKKYCRVYLLVLIVFLAVSMSSSGEGTFFAVYLMVLAAALGVTLVSYDEKSGWERYCDALPCSRELRVNERYLLSVILMGAVFVVLAVSQGVRVWITGASGREAALTLLNAFVCGLLTASISFPAVFRWGVEQGRLFYFAVIFAVVAMEVGIVKLAQALPAETVAWLGRWLIPALPVLALLIFLGSWRLSRRLYRKRVL